MVRKMGCVVCAGVGGEVAGIMRMWGTGAFFMAWRTSASACVRLNSVFPCRISLVRASESSEMFAGAVIVALRAAGRVLVSAETNFWSLATRAVWAPDPRPPPPLPLPTLSHLDRANGFFAAATQSRRPHC